MSSQPVLQMIVRHMFLMGTCRRCRDEVDIRMRRRESSRSDLCVEVPEAVH